MIKNKKILLVTTLIAMFAGISNVNAGYYYNIGFADTGEGGSTPQGEDIKVDLGSEGDTKYTCIYNYSIVANNGITISGYNSKNESLIENSLMIAEEDKILSGTSIGLRIYEQKVVKWQVTKAEVTAVKTSPYDIYTCTYTNTTPPKKPISPNYALMPLNLKTTSSNTQTIALNCSSQSATVSGSESCPYKTGCSSTKTKTGTGTTETTTPVKSGIYKTECETKAAETAKATARKNLGNSYIVSVTDSNDINGTNNMNVEVVTVGRSSTASGTKSGTESATYVYKKNNACINVKTANVTYNKTECDAEEIEIKNEKINNEEHWHYFVPLNTKSNQSAEIRLYPATGGVLVAKQCKYVMEHNPIKEGKTSYLDLIVKNDGTNFNGNASADTKEIEKNGCKLTSKIKITPKQRFYNEVITGDNITFQGFNFYYKPININDPFPNGISTNSIWHNWSKNGSNSPDLSKSYNEITYIAQNISVSAVRNYNKDNPYTSWSNMKIDGTSKFIDNEGIIKRNNDVSYYKLGCGPSNADWSECKS